MPCALDLPKLEFIQVTCSTRGKTCLSPSKQVLMIIKPPNLPQVCIKTALVGSLPAALVDPKLENGGVTGMNAPRAIAPH